MIEMDNVVNDFVTGDFTFKELAEKYTLNSVNSVHLKLIDLGLPEIYHADYNGTRKRFTQQKQNSLVMELLIDWFRTESKLKYISSADLVAEAQKLKKSLGFIYLPITENSVRHTLQSENIRLLEQDHQPPNRQERKQLNELMLKWFEDTGKTKMMTMSMIYEQAQVYAAKVGLKTISKSRAFVDNFMRTNDIRISDTPYAIKYNEQYAEFKAELSAWCEERRAQQGNVFNKTMLLEHAHLVKVSTVKTA